MKTILLQLSLSFLMSSCLFNKEKEMSELYLTISSENFKLYLEPDMAVFYKSEKIGRIKSIDLQEAEVLLTLEIKSDLILNSNLCITPNLNDHLGYNLKLNDTPLEVPIHVTPHDTIAIGYCN
jgi:hypothetical protein